VINVYFKTGPIFLHIGVLHLHLRHQDCVTHTVGWHCVIASSQELRPHKEDFSELGVHFIQ
jgi:hypothetical protein